MIDLRLSEAELDTAHDRITGFIADTVANAGADGAVLGLSGGIDSTLTAYLAVEALGKENLRGLVLPGEVSSEANMSDAERVARDLEIEYDVIEINPIVESFVSAVPEVEGDQVAVGNSRARVRAVLNYLLANHENRIVLGTGNRAEAAVGYYTKYGDGAVDCLPIGNLYKQQVRQLAHHVGVAEDLAEKTPTAELWEDQTDEGELGIDYDTLDAVLALHIDGPLSVSATSEAVGCGEDVVRDVRALYERSAHKRAMPPAPEQ
ncbi:NAD+ synthase [Halalkalicoccus jeotgali]|uniref:NH(3)-dependent NAD(+) synthetase n=1 Tax=Halalkalicoccus jeotgali (strain DSM 18796 / CECT 7217 / JCM 14584 / KCTC 4019 / B3) TaxID=795797 RepID=D8J8S9_HALJB|nr:NAD+ synthase [Halalkalicoccus jeotgali]ADJ14264.1 NAD synthetase [Halalkalicoccus jeotgali B3]ELY40526.1 NAD synthetase [Halalkalicoccus jeotgali B3]